MESLFLLKAIRELKWTENIVSYKKTNILKWQKGDISPLSYSIVQTGDG